MSRVAADRAPAATSEDPRLNSARKLVYASGDVTLNTALSALSIIFIQYFLTQVAGLRPELAAAVQLVGRAVDAFTDPAMGRLSDACRWKLGRRRPFLLIGAVPFGVTFALLWVDLGAASQWEMFTYYTGIYVLLSLAMTVLSIPYLALQPEMALGYDARTSLNTFRNAGSVLGILATVAFRPLAHALGDGPRGFACAGIAFGLLLALPWLPIFLATWERPEFQQRTPRMTLRAGLLAVARHRAFRKLVGLYLCGRVAMDLVGAMLILYFTHYMGRTHDFERVMLLFLAVVLVSLPFWLRVAQGFDKASIFIVGSLWWIVSLLSLLLAEPDWPRWSVFALAALGAVGYAVVDLMPWSMLGEVVDADDLATGERREGIYNGFFTFLRKLAGTIAVALALASLGALGLTKGDAQSETVRSAIRLLSTLTPAVFLALGVWIARGYPLSRERHARIVKQLAERNAKR
ncbi:MAG: glycoside-pentoside-hexuronide (GPH):cation symporter [Myxococcales bacterium]|nr:glycoside-pentoside-hexuronide (GPH):cation symporter [Myxococcales bacterium]MDH5565117.1 glycoside-pentoside-hexuronide (GPH):cation symporter [Myxococcales bacterium]